jgi:hypothetical protein
LALVKEDAGINHEDQLVTAFNKLAEQVHPLALGNVKRHISQSRMMARKLLRLHMRDGTQSPKIAEVVENLTSKSFYHGHPINRREAVDQIGISTVKIATTQEETLMWALYADFDQEMLNEVPFRPTDEFLAIFPKPTTNPVEITPQSTCKLAFVESRAGSDVSVLDYQISGQRLPTGAVKTELLTLRQAWVKVT